MPNRVTLMSYAHIQAPNPESDPTVSDAGLLDPFAIATKRVKAREDTAAGCDGLATSDLARAALADTENGRRKFERSAASWQQRAGLLQGIESGLASRSDRSEARKARAKRAILREQMG